jgi:hypothetical protein
VEGLENLARECAFGRLKRGHDIVLGGGSIREHNNGILGMRTPRNVFLIGSMLVQLAGIPAFPQQPPAAVEANPAPGCTATPQRPAANKRVAMESFRITGEARVALADPTYN